MLHGQLGKLHHVIKVDHTPLILNAVYQYGDTAIRPPHKHAEVTFYARPINQRWTNYNVFHASFVADFRQLAFRGTFTHSVGTNRVVWANLCVRAAGFAMNFNGTEVQKARDPPRSCLAGQPRRSLRVHLIESLRTLSSVAAFC